MMLLAKVLPDQALVTWLTPEGPHEVGYHTGHSYSSSRMVSRIAGVLTSSTVCQSYQGLFYRLPYV